MDVVFNITAERLSCFNFKWRLEYCTRPQWHKQKIIRTFILLLFCQFCSWKNSFLISFDSFNKLVIFKIFTNTNFSPETFVTSSTSIGDTAIPFQHLLNKKDCFAIKFNETFKHFNWKEIKSNSIQCFADNLWKSRQIFNRISLWNIISASTKISLS